MQRNEMYSTAGPRAFSEAPVGIAGLLMIFGSIKMAITASPLGLWLIVVPLALLGLLGTVVGLRSVIIRLLYNDNGLMIVTGPFRQYFSLKELDEVGYKRSGRTALYQLKNVGGHQLSLEVSRFKRDDEWKKVILLAAARTGANVDPRAQRSLEDADGTGTGYI